MLTLVLIWLLASFVIFNLRKLGNFWNESPPAPFSTNYPHVPKLPAAPDPMLPLPDQSLVPTYTAIQRSWVDTDATDADGYLGLEIHALVLASRAHGLRVIAHLNLSSAEIGPVRATDARYADANGDVAVSMPIPPSNSLQNLTAFIPLSALSLPTGDEHFTLTTALFNESNQAVRTGLPTPFNLPHGSLMVTRARLNGLPRPDGARMMNVSIQAPDRGSEIAGQIIVVFKDANGSTLPGRPPFINAAGELMSKAEFRIPAGPGVFVVNDVQVPIPANLVPNSGSAEIRLFDPRAGTWLTPPVRVTLP